VPFLRLLVGTLADDYTSFVNHQGNLIPLLLLDWYMIGDSFGSMMTSLSSLSFVGYSESLLLS